MAHATSKRKSPINKTDVVGLINLNIGEQAFAVVAKFLEYYLFNF